MKDAIHALPEPVFLTIIGLAVIGLVSIAIATWVMSGPDKETKRRMNREPKKGRSSLGCGGDC